MRLNHKLFFNQQAKTWDNNLQHSQIDRLKEIFKNHISPIGNPVLDIGSGTGILVPILKEIYGNSTRIVEMDIAENMLKSARVKFETYHSVDFINSDAFYLPFFKNTFETVIAYAVFPHFANKVDVLEEIFRVMKKNGLLVILHLMSHGALNNFHKNVGKAVENDFLPPLNDFSLLLEGKNYIIEDTQENENLYLIIARKG